MTNRERGSVDGRGKYNTLLGRWFKKDPSIPLVMSTDKGKELQRGSIVSLNEDGSHYLVIGVWKNNNKKWWISPESDHLLWPLTKAVIDKKSYRIKVRKMASTISPEGILEVKYMTLGIGSVEDGINVHSTYKIIKNLAAIKILHGEIDI